MFGLDHLHQWARFAPLPLRLILGYGYIDCDVLKARYLEEVRPYLLNKHEWHDQTLELWIEMIAGPSSNATAAPK